MEYTHESQGLPGVCVAMGEVEDSPSGLYAVLDEGG